MTIRRHGLRHGPRIGVLAASVGMLVVTGGLSGPVMGQDDGDDEAAANAQQDVIVVTGTRIRRDDFNSPNATTVVTSDDMRNLGVVSVADMINQLPNNVASITPETSANDNFNMGASIANLRGLNTYSGTRTLTLVDSRRVVPSNNGGGVDLNMIPTALVGRIETVTGGASATYGADAMAGVVNVILDNNIEGVRMDLSYSATGEGDGENYNLSLGTGFDLFEGRGQVTLGYDHSDQNGIYDCTTREYCRESRSLIRNGDAPGAGGSDNAQPYAMRDPILIPGAPEWVVLENMHYHLIPEGVLWGLGSPTASPEGGRTDPNDYTQGVYAINAAGTDIQDPMDFYDALTDEQIGFIYEQGVKQDSPWGLGNLTYKNLSLLPDNNRDNLYTKFNYELEGGIALEASLTYGKSESLSYQNSARQTQYTGCVFPDNAYLQPEAGATQRLIDIVHARRSPNSIAYVGETEYSVDPVVPDRAPNPSPFFQYIFGDGNCRPSPWQGTSFDPARADLFDFPRNGGTYVHKDLSPFINRSNTNDTETWNFTLGANGTLFEGSSWTWDGYLNHGETNREAVITDWQSNARLEAALFSVWDDTYGPVCAIDSRIDDPNDPNDVYSLTRAKWDDFLTEALQDEALDANGNVDQSVLDAYFNNLAFGCAPINMFGNDMNAAGLHYAFPEMKERTENTQDALSLTFSGDAWKGIGAGPFKMAAGVDLRTNDTKNFTGETAETARDFQGNGPPGGYYAYTNLDVYLNFGDNWAGETQTNEAFVEFEMPLLRDKPGADYLMFNLAKRRTQNETTRTGGTSEVDTRTVRRYQDSWKASMVWQPVDIMRVRVTRSVDTRAPSANELFQTNSPALNTGAMSEILNRNRLPVCRDPNEYYDLSVPSDERCPNSPPAGFFGTRWDSNAQYDLAESFEGGNSALSNEKSITETLGLVFTPNDALPGLQVSVDYYETTVKGGIENVMRWQTLSGCSDGINSQVVDWATVTAAEILSYADNIWYCHNLDFGMPDLDPAQALPNGEPNPVSNILSVATSRRNVSPYWSRGIDYSVSYFTQLSGGGTINARVLASRSLELSVDTENVYWGRLNVAGQTGSNGLNNQNGNLGTNYSPTPRISGNMFLTYAKNAFSITAQARYIGRGKLYIQEGWISEGETTYAYNTYPAATGGLGGPPTLVPGGMPYNSDLYNTVYDSELPSWTTLNLNFSYDFARSRFSFDRFKDLSTYLNIENVGDRVPDFFSGNGPGGINTTFFSGLGRQYRMGVRMQF